MRRLEVRSRAAPSATVEEQRLRPTTGVCKTEDFHTEWYRCWHEAMLGPWNPDPPADHQYRRKHWEWCAIAEVLRRRGMLVPGRKGIGFAVGKEPLPSLFAREGVEILATDLASTDAVARDWARTDQHADGLEALWHERIVDRERFREKVSFRFADMRDLSTLGATAPADFIWSSCSMEHLGSLELGMRFVLESARLLRPGGIAVHTTEYNVSSNDETLETENCVVYRERDILDLERRLRKQGFHLAPLDFDPGEHAYDREFDTEPYFSAAGRQHVKLDLGGHVVTSILLTVEAPRGD